MSLKLGNDYKAKGLYKEAIEAYRKVATDSPLKKHAEFNIKLLSKKADTNKNSPNLQAALSLSIQEDLPLLSIVMPVFNVAPYLDASINSALSQRYQNFELIIINDASTDNGRRIIEMYASEDDRIRFINLDHNTLGGAGIPSNIGIRAAKGKYIAFIDSDDWVKPDAFSELMQQALTHDADIVIGNFCSFTEDERIVKQAYDISWWKNLPKEELISLQNHPELLRLSPVPWRKIYKNDFLKTNFIEYPEGDYFYEDNPLHWHVLSEAKRVVAVDCLVSYHRMAREGQTMAAAEYKLSAMCSHLNTIQGYIKKAPSETKPILHQEICEYLRSRTDWIVKRQTQSSAKKLIQKRLAQIARKIDQENSTDTKKIFPEKKIKNYMSSYPDLDVTIVIPVFNSEDLLQQTLDSLLLVQGVKFNVLAVDDGSNDQSLKVLRKYEEEHENIHVFSQGNRGAGRARNSVIPLCTGTYTYFLDADDVIDSKEFEKAIALAMKGSHDLFFMKYQIELHESKKTRGMFGSDNALWDQLKSAKNNEARKKIFAQMINYPWIRLIKTSLLQDNNIFFGATVVHNDISYHWHSIISAKNIGYSEGSVCTHRKFDNRAQITNISDARRMAVLEALRFTHQGIIRSTKDNELLEIWKNFTKHLLKWAEDRIPAELKESYRIKSQNLLNTIENANSKNQEPASVQLFAERLISENQIEKAAVIYDLLAGESTNPDDQIKKRNKLIGTICNKRKMSKDSILQKIHLQKSTQNQKWLRVANWISESQGDPTAIDSLPLSREYLESSEILIAKANACTKVNNRTSWLDYLNKYLANHGISPLEILGTDDDLFLNLNFTSKKKEYGPVVTICISCFNAENYVEKAVRSLMQQSYQNIEILLYDDNSADQTFSIIKRLEGEDGRIRVFKNQSNNGTYVNRNRALQQAKGEFFTILDADDIALPERIDLQVRHLMNHENHVAVLTEWLRMDTNGKFLFKDGWGGVYSHEAVATIMVRTSQVRKEIGFWDSVRFAADTEFYKRLIKRFGDEAIHLLKTPTCLALFHEGSLTTDPVTGIDVNGKTGWSPVRSQYAASWRKWHSSAKNLYMPFPLEKRLFDAPKEMLLGHQK